MKTTLRPEENNMTGALLNEGKITCKLPGKVLAKLDSRRNTKNQP
jgi:hypothetical protein